MPPKKYKVTDPSSGKSLILTGDSPPTEQELIEIFSAYAKPSEQTEVTSARPPVLDKLGIGKSLLGAIPGARMAADAIHAGLKINPPSQDDIPGMLATGASMAAGPAAPLVRMAAAPVFGAGAEAGKQLFRMAQGEAPTDGGGTPEQLKRMGIGAAIQTGGEGLGVGLATKPAQNLLSKVGRGFARIGGMFSGKRVSDYTRLANEPSVLLPKFLGGPGSADEAGKMIGAGKKAMQVASSFDPNPPYGKFVDGAWEKATNDIPINLPDAEWPGAIKEGVNRLSPQETFNAYSGVKKMLNTAADGADETLKRARVIFKEALQERLGNLSGEFAEGSKQFAKASLRDTFTDIFPTTKYGMPSVGRLGFMGIPFGKAGLVLGSPVAHGAVTAGASVTNKLLKIPGVGPALAQTILRQGKREQK